MILVGVHLRDRLEGALSWGRRVLGEDARLLWGDAALHLRADSWIARSGWPTSSRASPPGSAQAAAQVGHPAPWHVHANDVWLALLVGVMSFVSFMERATLSFDAAQGPALVASPDLVGAAQVLLGCVALAWRRNAPGPVLVVCVASSVATAAEHYPGVPVPYAVCVALYTVGQRWPLGRSAVAMAAVAVVMGVTALLVSPAADDETITVVAAVVIAGALGRGMRMRQARSALFEDRARLLEEQAQQLAAEQATLSELAAARERATIARELHDDVAGNVSLIVAQAANARRSGEPEQAAALTEIEGIGRETLQDMRRLVGVLQSTEDDTPSERPTRLDRLEALVAKVAAVGVDVELTVSGDRRPLSAVVELNAYRIVQEALTNTMKHAAGAQVGVFVNFSPSELGLVVRDSGGRSTPTASPGNGLAGMRQRVDLLGGSMTASRQSDGGFAVIAQLPLADGNDA